MSIAEKLTAIAENVSKVYEAGQQSEYDRFWDAYQNNGKKTGYAYAFRGSGWNDETFRPKYPIVATGSLESGFRESQMTSLSNIDISGVTNAYVAFYAIGAKTIDKLDFSSATNTQSLFAHSTSLKTIGEIVSSETTVWHRQAFYNCYNLTNITFKGTIATDITCNSSKLTYDSLMSIINALKDYSAEGGTHTCTIGSTNLGKLTDTEKAIATEKGWTLA